MQGKQWSYLDILLLDGSKIRIILSDTGKSLSEALIFASTNPQYDKRLFMNNLWSYRGLGDASEKD